MSPYIELESESTPEIAVGELEDNELASQLRRYPSVKRIKLSQ